MKVKNYQELIAWQKAMDLVEEIYKDSKSFPREELYGLTSQIRRAESLLLLILQKVKGGEPLPIFSDTYLLPMVRCVKLKPRF